MYCSADRFHQYSISAAAAAETEKGQARATNLSFEKFVSWQDIGLENHVWYGPEDAEATKYPPKNVVVSVQKDKTNTAFNWL